MRGEREMEKFERNRKKEQKTALPDPSTKYRALNCKKTKVPNVSVFYYLARLGSLSLHEAFNRQS